MEKDIKYMTMALSLARRGVGFVSPNPMVGCVIVSKGKIIAKGYHKKFGGPHAEVEALRKITDNRAKITDLSVYINLEPCFHQGKTPPCADSLINLKPKRVVVGMKDPNPKVAGKGINKLRKAGIEVEVGVLEDECRELNKSFIKWITKKKPYVLLKAAVTLDGALTFKKGTRSDFSSPQSYARAHELRQEYDAIALGVESVLIDNPRLTTRFTPSQPPPTRGRRLRNPVRVVFDTKLRIQDKAKMFSEEGKTIIFTGPKVNQAKKSRIESKFKKVEIVSLPLGSNKHVSIKKCFNWLGKNGIASVQVEGGAEIANHLIEQDLLDEYNIIYTPHISNDAKAPRINLKNLNKHFDHGRFEIVGDDAWLISRKYESNL